MKKRIIYLDILKSIAIFFVCSYHFSGVIDCIFNIENMSISTYFNRFCIGIWSTCIPLFFMVNGALMLNQSEIDYKKYIYKIISLLVSFFIWRGITVIVLGIYFNTLKSIDFGNIINTIIFGSGLLEVDLAHFWFIPMFISIYIIYPFIHVIFSGEKKWLVIFMFLVLTGYFIYSDIGKILNLFPIFEGINWGYFSEFLPFKEMNLGMLVYFILGGWLHRERKKISSISTIKLLIILFLGKIGLFIEWLMISRDSGNNWDSVFGGYITVPTLLMSISIFILAVKYGEKIEKYKFISAYFEMIGNNTLGIYYLHWIIGYTLLVYIRENYAAYNGIFLNYIKSFIIIFILAFLSQKMKKLSLLKRGCKICIGKRN